MSSCRRDFAKLPVWDSVSPCHSSRLVRRSRRSPQSNSASNSIPTFYSATSPKPESLRIKVRLKRQSGCVGYALSVKLNYNQAIQTLVGIAELIYKNEDTSYDILMKRSGLPQLKQGATNDSHLLKAFFDFKSIPEHARGSLVTKFQQQILHVTETTETLVLPEKAPKLYKDRPGGQNIIDFLRDPDGWGPYVAAGILTKPVLRRLDWPAYKALDNWQRTKPIPPDVTLPTGKQVNDAALAAADAPRRAREGARLVAAIHYRQKASPQ